MKKNLLLYRIRLLQGFIYRRVCRFLPAQMSILNKMNIFLDSKYTIASFAEAFASRTYYPAIELFKYPPSSVLDLGAHGGFFTLLIEWNIRQRFLGTKVEYSLYEANPRLIAKIKRNLGFADLLEKTHIYSGAVGKRCGTADFGICRNLFFSNVSGLHSAGKHIRVAYLDIENNLLADGLDTPELIKLDIEGSEMDFFENYANLLSKACVVVVEFHYADILMEKWRDMVSKAGLQLYEVTAGFGITHTEILINHSNLSKHNARC